MKLFVVADMEGATGIVHRDQLVPEGGEAWRAGCRMLTGDINAVVAGALAEGVREVVVSEGHAHMRNVLLEQLHPAARLVCGPARWEQKPLVQVQGLDESFDLAFFVGFHSRAGTPDGLLSHTWVGAVVHELRLDGKVVGETALNAAICGAYGVPVGLVAGADDLAREARADLGPEVECVAVKRSFGFNLAECWGPKATAPMLSEAAGRAVRQARAGKLPVWRAHSPCAAEVDTHRREMCDRMHRVAGLERVGERTVRAVGTGPIDTLGRIWAGLTEALKEEPGWLK